jgi:hypothetical protein
MFGVGGGHGKPGGGGTIVRAGSSSHAGVLPPTALPTLTLVGPAPPAEVDDVAELGLDPLAELVPPAPPLPSTVTLASHATSGATELTPMVDRINPNSRLRSPRMSS